MPILSPLKPFFEGILASSDLRDERPVAEARAANHIMIDSSFCPFFTQYPPLPYERDFDIPVAGGEITVRVYSPVGSPAQTGARLPCHLYFHGGGFWLGTLDQSNAGCRGLAADANCVVVSVGYRLAPEHKFPTAPEDAYAALLWVVDHAEELGIDASRISVGGGSAGGNLAAVVALMARDRHGPAIVFQVLEIAVTDLTYTEPLRIDGLVVSFAGKEQYRAHYLSDISEASNPYASPLLAPDLTGLPPALVMCAEYDPHRIEAEAYVKKLTAAGVAVEYRCWEGQFHGSQQLSALIPDEAAAYLAQIVSALKRAYGVSQ